MNLNGNNYKEIINSFNKQDWKPLLDYISKIENVETFGASSEAKNLLEDSIVLNPQYVKNKVVNEFREIVYSIPIIIDYNWGGWDEGRKMADSKTFDYDTIDIPTKCKLITAIVRNDRFCDGALVSAFESGLILKILKSIQKQII